MDLKMIALQFCPKVMVVFLMISNYILVLLFFCGFLIQIIDSFTFLLALYGFIWIPTKIYKRRIPSIHKINDDGKIMPLTPKTWCSGKTLHLVEQVTPISCC